MKTILSIFAVTLLLTACSSKPTKEMLQVRAVNNTDECNFITMKYLETAPWNTMRYIQKNVVKNKGDSYKMISSTPLSILAENDAVGSNFEIYKCRK
jgi:nitrous oxide reductase accessory protein NosL